MNDDQMLKKILQATRTIASVGVSSNPEKESNEVALYLKEHGYRVIPVNPSSNEIIGETSYPDLASIPDRIDVVQVFRKPEDVPPVVEDAIRVGAKVIWMQEDIRNEQAAARAREAGLQVVMDACMKKTHRRLFGDATGQ